MRCGDIIWRGTFFFFSNARNPLHRRPTTVGSAFKAKGVANGFKHCIATSSIHTNTHIVVSQTVPLTPCVQSCCTMIKVVHIFQPIAQHKAALFNLILSIFLYIHQNAYISAAVGLLARITKTIKTIKTTKTHTENNIKTNFCLSAEKMKKR